MSVQWRADRSLIREPFASDVDVLLTADPALWVIDAEQGFRTFALQDALYAQGRTTPGAIVTNAKGGQSPHNYGLAVDVTLLTPRGADWNYAGPDWQRLIAAVRAAPRLHPGAAFGDMDHIEAVHWQQLKTP